MVRPSAVHGLLGHGLCGGGITSGPDDPELFRHRRGELQGLARDRINVGSFRHLVLVRRERDRPTDTVHSRASITSACYWAVHLLNCLGDVPCDHSPDEVVRHEIADPVFSGVGISGTAGVPDLTELIGDGVGFNDQAGLIDFSVAPDALDNSQCDLIEVGRLRHGLTLP